MTRFGAVLATLLLGISMNGQTVYYASASGSDANAGTSRNSPWRTLARSRELHAGDRLLLAGGSVFTGSIHIPASRITISSYGIGRASIDAGDGTAIDASDVSDLIIANINLRGTSLAHKVFLRSAIDITSRGVKSKSLTIDRVEISGFSLAAINVQGGAVTTGIDGISITNVSIHDVGYTGISITCDEPGAFTNVLVQHSDIGPITGYLTSSGVVVEGSGSGISILGANGGSIRENVIHDSGTTAGGGQSGIELRRTIDFLIESNEVRDVHARDVPAPVAAAIDIDGGTSHTVRYNYTHDDDGPGIRLCGCFAPLREEFVHDNISQNDGIPAAIDIEGSTDSMVVANNTVLTSGSTVLRTTGSTTAIIIDNLLLTQNGGTEADIVTGTTMRRNDYWNFSGGLSLRMNGAAFSSISSWGQDSSGISGDPQFAGGYSGALLPDASLSDLEKFRTEPFGAGIDTAEDLPAGYNRGLRDFYGGDSFALFGTDLGAYELRPQPYAPLFEPIASQSVLVGDSIDVDVWFHDPDGTRDATLTLVSAPSGTTLRRAGGGHAIVTITPLAATLSSVTIQVTDGTGLTAQVSFNVAATGGIHRRAARH